MLAGKRLEVVPSATSSQMPSRSNSVYSTFVTLYAYSQPAGN